jgi:CRP/FNR family transcriptional regulator
MKRHEASIQRLNTVPYPTCLDRTVLATIAARCQRKWLRRGQFVFMEGEPCQHLYTLESGRVKCYRANADGREQIVKVFDRPGDTFCTPSAFNTGKHIVTARTVTGTWLHLMDIEMVKHLAEANPSVLPGLLASACDQMKSLVVLAGDLALKTATARLAKLLYERATRERVPQGQAIHLRRESLPAEELASLIGTVRVHVSRGLNALVSAGAIRLSREVISISDLELLKLMSLGTAERG